MVDNCICYLSKQDHDLECTCNLWYKEMNNQLVELIVFSKYNLNDIILQRQ